MLAETNNITRLAALVSVSGDHDWSATPLANRLSNLAVELRRHGSFGLAEKLQAKAASIYRAADRLLERPETLILLHRTGNLLRNQGRYADAAKLYEEVLEAQRRVLGPDHKDTILSMQSLARTYRDLVHLDAAAQLQQQVLDKMRAHEALGPGHEDTAASMSVLAGIYSKQRRYDKAEGIYREAIRIMEVYNGPNFPGLQDLKADLAQVLVMQNRFEEATPYFRQAVLRCEADFGANNLKTGKAYINLSLLLQKQGCYAEAAGMAKKGLNVMVAVLGTRHPDTANAQLVYGLISVELRNYAEAANNLTSALRVFEATYGQQGPRTVACARRLNNLRPLLQPAGPALAAGRWRHITLGAIAAVVGAITLCMVSFG